MPLRALMLLLAPKILLLKSHARSRRITNTGGSQRATHSLAHSLRVMSLKSFLSLKMPADMFFAKRINRRFTRINADKERRDLIGVYLRKSAAKTALQSNRRRVCRASS